LIKKIENKYVRRAVWLVALPIIGVAVTVWGAILGAADLLTGLWEVAVEAW
jgi:hypothetical protein